MIDPVFTQDGFRVRLEWGPVGLAALGAVCPVLVVVDVLSFTTSVDVALGRGARIMPLRRDRPDVAAARAAGAVLAGEDRWTLRPSSLVDIPAGTLLAVPSPNGATLCAAAAERPGVTVLAGCLRNAGAVAAVARSLAGGRPIGVLPAGERWAADGSLRPCAADQLGAGAIVSALADLGVAPVSPEAWLAAHAYRSLDPVDDVPRVLAESASGREVIVAGRSGDVELASAVDVSRTVPVLTDGILAAAP